MALTSAIPTALSWASLGSKSDASRRGVVPCRANSRENGGTTPPLRTASGGTKNRSLGEGRDPGLSTGSAVVDRPQDEETEGFLVERGVNPTERLLGDQLPRG